MANGSSSNNHVSILIVDDEPLVRRSLSEFLTLEGYTVGTASNGSEALESIGTSAPDIIITDIKMPEMDGVELIRTLKKCNNTIPVILVTGYASIESAVEAMKEGAYDYITKPIIDSEIKLVIERLIKQRQILQENVMLKEQVSGVARERFAGITGKSPQMQKIYYLIEAIADTRATVLINGESGTGKHLIAHAIHSTDKLEAGKPFVEVSCGALTETLLESELFGHVRGAFTGAIKDKMGRFELASDGSIFLDEIDAFTPALQVKLLRFLQEGEFERVGDTKTVKVDVRIIAASNQNLQDLIAQGKFRKDLYYRLNIINIEVPPLRERKSDIPLLVEDFIVKHTQGLPKRIQGISDEALQRIMEYSWPGNIRELENIIERAIILSKGTVITREDLPDMLNNFRPSVSLEETLGATANGNGYTLKDALKSPERELIMKALDATSWNRNEAAEMLGINRTTLYKKMVRFELLKTRNGNGRKK
jgi:DNA-binding NtrC family response regulator